MREEIYAVYSADGDMSFIMKDVFDVDGNAESTEVVGWYYGEPNDDFTKAFVGKLTAEY